MNLTNVKACFVVCDAKNDCVSVQQRLICCTRLAMLFTLLPVLLLASTSFLLPCCSTPSQSTTTARTWTKSTSRTPSHCDSLCSRPKWAATDGERTAASLTWVKETVVPRVWMSISKGRKVHSDGSSRAAAAKNTFLVSVVFRRPHKSMKWKKFTSGKRPILGLSCSC